MNNIILKTTNKRILYFYESNGICVKNLTMPSQNPKMIFEDAVSDFDVIQTDNGDAGIICQNKEGSIIFLKETSGGYLKSTLLKNKSKSAYNKFFQLHRHGCWISVIYIINYDGKNILSFQIVDKENQIPEAIDEIEDFNYFSFTDRFGNVFLLYNRDENFGYRIFNWGIKEWSEFVSLGKGKLITAINDFEDNYYFACKMDGKIKFGFINYSQNFETDYYDAPVIEDESNISFVFEKEFLWLVKEINGNIYGIKFSDNFKQLGYPMFFGSESDKKYYTIKSEEMDYKINKCWGYEKDHIPKIVIFKDLYNTSKVTEQEEFTADEEIKMLKTKSDFRFEKLEKEIEDLKIDNQQLSEKIAVLENEKKMIETNKINIEL